jgi:mandelate racemase
MRRLSLYQLQRTKVKVDLKIRRFNARAVIVPMSLPLHVSTGAVVQAPLVLIDCETDQGVFGHAYLIGISPVSLKPLVSLVQSFSDLLAGDALAPYEIERKLTQKFTLLGMAGLLRLAQAGIDMAAWDALARSQNLSLATLLGSKPKPIRAYNSKGLGIMPEAKLIDEAQALLDEGFSAVKMRLGRVNALDDLKAVRAVRKAIGDSVNLMSDFNQALSVHEAIRRGHMLDDEGLVWIEEPVRQDDYEGCAKVARELKTPIQIGENFASAHEMLAALKAGACDLVMPDAQRIGGVTGWLRAAALAHAQGVEMSTHLFSEVSAHLMTVTPTAHWLEYVDWANPVLQQPLQIKDGHVLTSERPGSGVEWDETAVKKYLVA